MCSDTRRLLVTFSPTPPTDAFIVGLMKKYGPFCMKSRDTDENVVFYVTYDRLWWVLFCRFSVPWKYIHNKSVVKLFLQKFLVVESFEIPFQITFWFPFEMWNVFDPWLQRRHQSLQWSASEQSADCSETITASPCQFQNVLSAVLVQLLDIATWFQIDDLVVSNS